MNFTKRILIVDDSPTERKLLKGLLRKRWPNLGIQEAADGVEGLVAVKEWLPDVVLTDLCMPQSSGWDLLAAMRSEKSLTPVVVISGDDKSEIAVAAFQAGAASFVSKLDLSKLLVPTLETVLDLAATHSNRRRVIDCLKCMDLRFELNNDHSLVTPLVRYLEDHLGSLKLCDELDLIRVGMALHESLLNAIHHGNLELDSELRQEEESIYYELAEARKLMWPYCDRKVHVFASLNVDKLKFVIRDDGPGFNHNNVIDSTAAENMQRIGGRGLLLIRSFMDQVTHNDLGNEITLIKYTNAGQKLLANMNETSLNDTLPEFQIPATSEPTIEAISSNLVLRNHLEPVH